MHYQRNCLKISSILLIINLFVFGCCSHEPAPLDPDQNQSQHQEYIGYEINVDIDINEALSERNYIKIYNYVKSQQYTSYGLDMCGLISNSQGNSSPIIESTLINDDYDLFLITCDAALKCEHDQFTREESVYICTIAPKSWSCCVDLFKCNRTGHQHCLEALSMKYVIPYEVHRYYEKYLRHTSAN